jgi:exopolyphosphatase / guanosine-5'-triphosphate,3'-diphosphate pyrophosphatase
VRPVAAIDCGTNSLRLLVLDPATGRDVVRETRIVRLGEGVDRTGRLGPAAIERARVVLVEYASAITASGAERVRMVATSATRDAANRDEFAAMVRATLGVEPEVISGDEEARLSFLGAVGDGAGDGVLVVDVGGGSTEVVLGPVDALRARSLDIGSVRLTERHFASDPPSATEIAAARADVDAALGSVGVPLDRATALVGVAGTAITVAAVALDRSDPSAVHGARVPASQVIAVTERLLAASAAERAAVPQIHPGRVDVIAAGALILRRLVEVSGVEELVVSVHDILDGVARGLT